MGVIFVLVLIEDIYVYWVQVGRFGRFTSRAYVDWIHAHLTARRKRLRIL